jgi:Mrp family chromosome partitioning ATPase
MGRMLEAFKLTDPQRPPTAEEPTQPQLAWPTPEPALPEDVESGEEVPFIEVGGPRSTTEASPRVLAASGKATAKTTVQGPRLRPVALPTLGDTLVRVMTVVFRRLPEELVPASPAHRRFAPELIAFHRSEHPVSEQYRSLAGSIAAQLSAGRSQVVLFTALTPEAGTTTVLLNTAITYARQGGLRVAVVDANLRRPAIARRLGLPEAPGLGDFLAGTATLAQAMQETGQPNLLALTAGTAPVQRPLGDAVRPALRQLRERFDLVLVDAPCWDGRPEMVALSSACDVVYLVLPDAEADTPDTQAWLHLLPQQGTPLRGCIVTQR